MEIHGGMTSTGEIDPEVVSVESNSSKAGERAKEIMNLVLRSNCVSAWKYSNFNMP
jgi:hypothetical protein